MQLKIFNGEPSEAEATESVEVIITNEPPTPEQSGATRLTANLSCSQALEFPQKSSCPVAWTSSGGVLEGPIFAAMG